MAGHGFLAPRCSDRQNQSLSSVGSNGPQAIKSAQSEWHVERAGVPAVIETEGPGHIRALMSAFRCPQQGTTQSGLGREDFSGRVQQATQSCHHCTPRCSIIRACKSRSFTMTTACSSWISTSTSRLTKQPQYIQTFLDLPPNDQSWLLEARLIG